MEALPGVTQAIFTLHWSEHHGYTYPQKGAGEWKGQLESHVCPNYDLTHKKEGETTTWWAAHSSCHTPRSQGPCLIHVHVYPQCPVEDLVNLSPFTTTKASPMPIRPTPTIYNPRLLTCLLP